MLKRYISDKDKSFSLQNNSLKSDLDFSNIKLQLREEKLDISKNKILAGKVNIYKEIIRENKTITIPIIREEIVIEKNVFNDKEDGHTDTIRIPIMEERIKITKHPVILQKINIYNKKFQDIKQVKENLKKENLHIQTIKDAKIVDTKANDTYS